MRRPEKCDLIHFAMEVWSGEKIHRKAFRVEAQRPWESYFDTGLNYDAVSLDDGSAVAEAIVDLAFTRERISVGKQWMSIACSGAWLELTTTTGHFTHATESVLRNGTQRVRQQRTSSVNTKSEIFEYACAHSVDAETEFSGEVQGNLSTSISPERGKVKWSIELTRSAQAVRDCMDENVRLCASLGFGDRSGELTLRAAPIDCRLLDARNRTLGRLATIGLFVKLKILGVDLVPKIRTFTVSLPALADRCQTG